MRMRVNVNKDPDPNKGSKKLACETQSKKHGIEQSIHNKLVGICVMRLANA